MPEITEQSVNEKLGKGEALTPEENKFVMSLPPGEGESNEVPEDEEPIDWGKAADLDGGEASEKKEEKAPEEKQKEADAAQKTEELKGRAKALGLPEDSSEEVVVNAETKKKEQDENDPFLKIEKEMAKPEGRRDFTGWTPREKAYFHQMEKDRKARQQAQEDRDAALFREIKSKQTKKADEEVVAEDPLAELKKKDPEDYMNVGEVVKILEKVITAKPKTDEKPAQGFPPAFVKLMELSDKEAKANHPEDYDAVMELTEDLINNNPAYLKQIHDGIIKGDNPAEITYKLIKDDPQFATLFPAAQTRALAKQKKVDKPGGPAKSPEDLKKEKEAQAAQDKLKENQNKKKTTVHAGGEGGQEEGDTIDGYSIQDIYNMSDLTFAKLPKSTRDKFLEKYGA